MAIKHISWTSAESYEDRLVLRITTPAGGKRIESAEATAIIKGVIYAVVRKEHHGAYFETYRVGPDGVAKECNSGQGGWPRHYRLLHEGKAVILQSCNDDYGNGCSLCRAKREAA